MSTKNKDFIESIKSANTGEPDRHEHIIKPNPYTVTLQQDALRYGYKGNITDKR